MRWGKWVSAEGLIYPGFDPAVHIVDRFAIPKDWTTWVSVDFGFNHPFVAQIWAEDGDGRLYLVLQPQEPSGDPRRGKELPDGLGQLAGGKLRPLQHEDGEYDVAEGGVPVHCPIDDERDRAGEAGGEHQPSRGAE